MYIGMVGVLCIFLAISAAVTGKHLSDEDSAHLPRLFHLDDHDRCLLQEDGLYCLGEFELYPIKPGPLYELIKEYSSNPFAFNRSRLYRGYCVSARCPSAERNATLRFERCVNERARHYALSARLRTLRYCTTQQQHKAKAKQPPDSAQQLFLKIVGSVLVLNLVGTVYDFVTVNREKKNGLLLAWSVRVSWRRLIATYDDDPRLNDLEPIQGIRVATMATVMYAHASLQHYQYYVTNPNFLENRASRADGVLMVNGTSLIQAYVIISSFLTAYNMLLYSQKHQLSFVMVPVLVIKRIIRIAPVHLLVVGYAATWWPQARSGALSATIGETSAICRRKFWTHAFFLNNVMEAHDQCLVSTWFLPVDMHLFIFVCTLTVVMSRRRSLALHLYAALFVGSAVLCGTVIYITGWQATINYSVPDNARGLFSHVESFRRFYLSSWAALPACFVGLLIAHLHFELQERKYDCSQHKWLKRFHMWCIPLGIAWIVLSGTFLQHYSRPLVTAVYVTVDKLICCSLLFFLVFGTFNVDSPLRRFFGWKGWRVAARLSLPVMLCHWVINTVISAKPVAYHTSMFDVSIEYLATVFYSYAVALTISILVEIPVQRFFSQFF